MQALCMWIRILGDGMFTINLLSEVIDEKEGRNK